MPTSGRFNHPDGSLPPPERRRRLDEYGSVEDLYSYSRGGTGGGGAGAVGGIPVHAQRSRGDIFQELMSRRAHDMITGAQDVVAGAGMIREETQRQNRALRGENDTLRVCVDMLLSEAGGSAGGGGGGSSSSSSGVSPFESSPMQLLSAARGVRDRNHQRELALSAAAASAQSALRAERSRREGAEVEARRPGAPASSSSSEARGRRQNQQQQVVVGRGYWGESFSMALRAFRRENGNFMNAVEDRKRAERALEEERADRLRAEAAARTALEDERARREQAENLAKCVLCSSRRRSRTLLPCGHLVLCDRCPVVSTCPICDQQVRRTMPSTLS
ncbi:unnamed protein product [Ectocarpus fasciculatus]